MLQCVMMFYAPVHDSSVHDTHCWDCYRRVPCRLARQG